MAALGILSRDGGVVEAPPAPDRASADGPIEKRAIRAGSVLNEAYDYATAVLVHARAAVRHRRQDDAHDLGDGEHRRRRTDQAHRRFPRAALADLSQHHRAARVGGRDLARHRPDHLLPARHRARLQETSTRCARHSSPGSASTRCPRAPASRRGSAARTCSSRSRRSPSCRAAGARTFRAKRRAHCAVCSMRDLLDCTALRAARWRARMSTCRHRPRVRSSDSGCAIAQEPDRRAGVRRS